MPILPLQLARVSNRLRTTVATGTMARTQQRMLETQNQLASGKRLNAPSDDPGDAAIAMQLQKTLERRQAYSDNLQQAVGHLGEVDSTLGDLSELLRQAQTLASANVGSDVTAEARQGAAEIAKSLYNQALTLGNRQFEGIYLFGGDRGNVAPFVEENGGVKFAGSSNVLKNRFDDNTVLPFMVDGEAVFGALSTRVQGTADLTPRLTAATRLVDLGGAAGEGIHLGMVQVSNGTSSALVDLSNADTVGDVIDALEAGLPGLNVGISAAGTGLSLSGGASDNLSLVEVGGGTMARDLGILQAAPAGAGLAITGAAVAPRVTPLTRLSDLRSASATPMDWASGLSISNGLTSQTVSFAACTTVEDMLNAINGSGTGVRAVINDSATGINIFNPTQGTELRIGENGGSTAADLGVRSLNPATELAELNYGRGVGTVAGGDIQIALADGSIFNVDLSLLNTMQEVITAINTAAGSAVASFNPTGNGLRLTDPTTGPGQLRLTALNFSTAAQDLGLDVAATGNVLVGRDVHPVKADGVFFHLGQLRDALAASDQRGITAAAEGLKADYDRVVRIRGQAGAQVQELEHRQERLADENLASHALLSSLEDTDFTQAITEFQMLQTALQATLQTSGKILNLSLLDFIS